MGMRLGCKQTEIGELPEDWTCERVGNAAANRANAIVGGPFGSDLVSKDYVSQGVPVSLSTSTPAAMYMMLLYS